jgi:VWFA-related protein
MVHRRVRTIAVVVVWMAGALVAGAQSGAVVRPPILPPVPQFPQPAQAPVFRARVDIVQVDVTVLDDQRRPVRGLKPSDFRLFEDGQSQEIVAFTEMAASDPDVPRGSWLRTVVPDVKVNNAEDGRLLLIIMDDARTPIFRAGTNRGGPPQGLEPKEAAKQAARAVVERMGPNDMASVIFTLKNKNEQEFTSDRDRLFAAIDGFSPLPDVEEQYNAMTAMSTYGDAAKILGSIPHRRKAIIVISSSSPPVIPLEIHPAYVTVASGVKLEGLKQEALEAAFRGNVTFYNINPFRILDLDAQVDRALAPEGGAGPLPSGARFGQPTSELPAPPRYYDRDENPVVGTPLDQLTGGFSIRTPAEFAAGITQIFRESGSYYLLGYASPNLRDDGKLRRISVRLKDLPHAVRSRAGFIPPKKEREVKTSPLWGAISGLTPAKDIAMRVNVAPFAIPDKKEVALAITLGLRQPVDIGTGAAIKETVTFLTQAFSTKGDRRGSPRYNTVTLDLKPNASGEVKYEVLSRLDLKPGRYHIRMSAQSRALGKSGSIYYDIDIPDFSKAPLSMSGVILSTTPGLASGPRELLKMLLPAVPTSQREFAGHQGTAFFRLYQGGKGPLVPVSLMTRIVDAANAVVFDHSEVVAADRFDARHRAADHKFALPIDAVGPGVYLLTFRAAAGDGPTAMREVRFTVSASTVR